MMKWSEPEEGVDFLVVDHPKATEQGAVRVLRAPWDGVVVLFGKISFGRAENADGTLTCTFDYDILEGAGKTGLEASVEFRDFLGDTVISLAFSKLTEKENDDHRANDPQEPGVE